MRLFPLPLMALILPCSAGEIAHSESWYRDQAAAHMKGTCEVPVPKGRVDIVTETHAIEVEFAPKWKNAIGQALWYAFQTNKEAGIVLIVENRKRDLPHYVALGSLIEHQKLPIKVWLWPDDFKPSK